MLTTEELQKVVVMNEELAETLKTNPFPGVPWEKFDALRQMAEAGADMMAKLLESAVPEGLEEYTVSVTMRDGYSSKMRVTRPTPAGSGRPLIVLYYGGGFAIGNPVQMSGPARVFAKAFDAVVVCPTYRLAPENPFPYGVHDGQDSLRWCAAHADELGADPKGAGFIVGGSSAGGNISSAIVQAMVVSAAAEDKGLPLPTGLYLNIPYIGDASVIPSQYQQAGQWISRSQPESRDSICLSNNDIDEVLRLWKPDLKSPLYSPLNYDNGAEARSHHPRTVFGVCGLDPLRDDSYVYQDLLEKSGVETKLYLYPGLPHSFNTFWPTMKISRQMRIDQVHAFAWLLRKEVSGAQAEELVDKYLPIANWD